MSIFLQRQSCVETWPQMCYAGSWHICRVTPSYQCNFAFSGSKIWCSQLQKNFSGGRFHHRVQSGNLKTGLRLAEFGLTICLGKLCIFGSCLREVALLCLEMSKRQPKRCCRQKHLTLDLKRSFHLSCKLAHFFLSKREGTIK